MPSYLNADTLCELLSFQRLIHSFVVACVPFSIAALVLLDTSAASAQDKPANENSAIAELTEEEQQQVKTAERFLTVLEKNPRRGTALDRVYGHHVEFGTLDKFIASLRQRAEKSPNDGAIWMLIGLFESQRGSDADAVEAYSKAEQLRAQDAIACYYLGQAQLRLGDSAKAAESLERAILRKPQRADQLEIFQTLGRIHQRAQRTTEALEVWQRLEKLFPGDARVLEQIAVTLVEENQPAEALPRYAKLAELVTDDYRRVTFKISQAELTIKTGKKPDGIKAFESILASLNPDSWLHRDVRRRIDDVFLRSGDQDGLVKYYQSWLESHPEDVEGMSRLARFLSNSARVPEAIVWLEKAIKLAPSRTDLRKTFIDLLAGEQRFNDANKQYQELLKAAPNNPDYLREWGKLVMRNRERSVEQRREEAFQIWNRMIDPNAKDAVTVSQVADLCRQNQLSEKAEQLYRRAIEFAPNDPQYREYLGEFLHVQKRSDEAMKVWNEIAAGGRRNATNLARLAEVFNSFGFSDQACQQISDAVKLDAKDLSLLLKAADYHTKASKHDEALALCDQAQKIVANEDEREEVIKQRINVLQANQQLETLSADLLAQYKKPEAKPTFEQWYEIGRYFESNRRWVEANEAMAEALKLQPRSILTLITQARIAEGSGDFGKAADINRQLAEVDRRSLGDHLANVSRLEAQLGRAKEALEAAQKLIIAAPSKTENYEFYAQTCFRLGKPEEGLTALRKAMRINPNDPSLMRALASALSDQMRTEEAIEVYWRAFEKSDELDDKTTITQRLAPLYQIINQTDKLFERLERGRQEEETRRAFTVCIAQAWQTLGDLNAARKELEGLLGENTRDTNLLNQLSKLCETDGDFESAINYQRQLVSIAPGDETEAPLATMYLRSGRFEEAKEIFLRLIQREEDPVRQLRSLDSLLTNGNFDSAIQLIEPLLEKRRDDWELLYRQGMAWASLNNVAEAKSRFDRLLAVSIPYDSLGRSAEAKLKQAQAKAKSDNLRGVQTALPQRETPLAMVTKASQVNMATGYTSNNVYYAPGSVQPVWMPDAYGVARMAVFSWLLKFDQDSQAVTPDASPDSTASSSDKQTEIAERIRAKAEGESAARNDILDWLYVAQLKNDYAAIFNVAKRLAKTGGKEEQRYLLANTKLRESKVDQYNNVGQSTGSPLSEEDLALVEQCFTALTNNEKDVDLAAVYGGNIAYGSNGQAYVLVGQSYQMLPGVFRNNGGFTSLMIEEYRKAGKTDEANKLVEKQVSQAKTAAQFAAAGSLLFEEKRFDEIMPLLDKWQEAALKQIAETPIVTGRNRSTAASIAVLTAVSNLVQRMMASAATEEDSARIIRLLNNVIPVAVAQARYQLLQAASQARPTSTISSSQGTYSISTYKAGKQVQANLTFPPQNGYVDSTMISLLRQAFESLGELGAVTELAKLLNEKLQSATPEQANFFNWCLASIHWWNDETDEAMNKVTQIAASEKQNVGFQMMLANLHQSRNELEEALNVLQNITAKDQQAILRREMAIMNIAERMGDLDRARESAQKVFGLRTDSQTQQGLIAQMRRLGLTDYADAMIARLERTAGRQADAQLTLMNLLFSQGKSDQAIQVANSVLRKTTSPYAGNYSKNTRNPMRYSTSDSQSRHSALQMLNQSGALKSMIQQLKSQLERAPNSPKILEQLAEFATIQNQRDESIKYLEELSKLRPDSAIYHLHLASHYSRMNKPSEACDHYIAILKTNPKWIGDNLNEVDRIFTQAKRRREFVELMVSLDVRGMEPYYLIQTATSLLRDANTTDLGIRLIEKALAGNPNSRQYALSNLANEQALKNEKIYQIFKRSTLPSLASIKSDPWFGVNEIRSYSGEGRVNSMLQDALNNLRSTPHTTDFESSLKKLVDENPEWLGGVATLAIQEMQSGRKSAGVEKLKAFFEPKKKIEKIPSAACWIIGQELAEYEQTQDLAVELLEQAQKTTTSGNEINYTPMAKLVSLYSKMPDKKELGLKYLRSQLATLNGPIDNSNYQYNAYRSIQSRIWIAEKLELFGRPAEAAATLRVLLNDPNMLAEADNWNGGPQYNSKTRGEPSSKRYDIDWQG
ncbi:MAG: tetratricopeptide repeat protein [Pirellulales bacterium]